ncbi:hypothetical protein CSPX01_09817 [Colletotrichum filicis]|nr:hypothetical protein CSPX01_09817 [Colletotrichum filicis]
MHPPTARSDSPSDLTLLFALHALDGDASISVHLMVCIAGLADFDNFTRLLHSKSRVSDPKWFSLNSRVSFAYSGIRGSVWTLKQTSSVVPELRSLTRELLISWRLGRHDPVVMTLAAVGIGASSARAPHGDPAQSETVTEYARLADQIIALDPDSLIKATKDQWKTSPMHMFMWYMLTNMQPCSADQADKIIQSALLVWVTTLYRNKVDLINHGRQSQMTYSVRRRFVLPEWSFRMVQDLSEPRKRHQKRERYYRAEYVGITYGSLPEHWKIWWAVEYECYAGDFWRTLEDSAIQIPGSWVDDRVFDDEKLMPSWVLEEIRPLIWSEYRKIRPPV